MPVYQTLSLYYCHYPPHIDGEISYKWRDVRGEGGDIRGEGRVG
jgi:hypothetical protein